MTVRLRPHHLLCLLTYVGKGYTPAFTLNYDAVVARLNDGEDVLIVGGPDDICAPMLETEEHHCLRASVRERDEQAADAVTVLLGRPVKFGTRMVLDAATVRHMREAFAQGVTRHACLGCEWSALCGRVAGLGFTDTRFCGA